MLYNWLYRKVLYSGGVVVDAVHLLPQEHHQMCLDASIYHPGGELAAACRPQSAVRGRPGPNNTLSEEAIVRHQRVAAV